METKLAVEEIVSKLPGVHGARIVNDEDGEMVEIHVLADVSKPAKQLVRDIETAIFAASGVKIDRKIVSIAQIALDSEEKRLPQRTASPKKIRRDTPSSYKV